MPVYPFLVLEIQIMFRLISQLSSRLAFRPSLRHEITMTFSQAMSLMAHRRQTLRLLRRRKKIEAQKRKHPSLRREIIRTFLLPMILMLLQSMGRNCLRRRRKPRRQIQSHLREVLERIFNHLGCLKQITHNQGLQGRRWTRRTNSTSLIQIDTIISNLVRATKKSARRKSYLLDRRRNTNHSGILRIS